MKEFIATGIYLCRKKHYKHRTIERFYLYFTGFLQHQHFHEDTIETIERLGNLFFEQDARRHKFISFRATKQKDGFYLTVGKDYSEEIVEVVKSLCGFIVGIKEDVSYSVPDLTGAKIIASDHYVLLNRETRPTHL